VDAENVRPQLDGKAMRREEIGDAVRQFTNGDEHPVFWAIFPLTMIGSHGRGSTALHGYQPCTIRHDTYKFAHVDAAPAISSRTHHGFIV
jgi:hypothetical protein